jgi:hypothetical protein
MGPELALAYANRSAVLGMCSKSFNPHNWFLSKIYEDPKGDTDEKAAESMILLILSFIHLGTSFFIVLYENVTMYCMYCTTVIGHLFQSN